MKASTFPIFLFLLLTIHFLIVDRIRAQENLEPEVFAVTFSDDTLSLLESDDDATLPDDWPEWIRGISQSNGSIVDNQSWQGGVNSEDETAFNLHVDNETLKGDLALTLSFSAEAECDFAIQLYDDNNKVVAVDLFGNVSENSVLAGTDTYIVPMSKHPTATRIAIRQVSGQLTLYGLLAFSVLSELPADTEAEMTMLNLLGGQLSENSRLYRALDNMIPNSNQSGLTGPDGKPLTRDEAIKSLRTEVIRDLAKTETEFEQRLIGTEWYLQDFYRRRLARFLPDGKMLQQHVDDDGKLVWDESQPELPRGYKVLNSNSVLFGIGGFVATFNDNFTEMTYETTGGRKGQARLIGRFSP